jgi:hypothetical protein
MILKLIDQKVLIETMFIPELVDHTYVQLVFEPNTSHLHPVLFLNDVQHKGDRIFIDVKNLLTDKEVVIKVELLDDQNKVIRRYESKVEYNRYQIFGNKPIRPDIEEYLYKLEEEIRFLKEELIKEKERFVAEQNRLNEIIKEIEERGEIV